MPPAPDPAPTNPTDPNDATDPAAAPPGAAWPPAGFVDLDGACRMFGVSTRTWNHWQSGGTVRCGRWVIRPGMPARRRLYPIDELERLRAALARQEELATQPYPDPARPGVYRVRLSSGKHEGMEAVIDAESVPRVRGTRCWWVPATGRRAGGGSVVVKVGGTNKQLRQVVMGVDGPRYRVSHLNGDPLDCRRANLVVRSSSEQGAARRKAAARDGRPSTSRFKGVNWEHAGRKWKASIKAAGRKHKLGRFLSEIDAALAYDAAARELFGEHARLNFADPGEAERLRGAWLSSPPEPRPAPPPPRTVDVDGACQMFGIPVVMWTAWERQGRMPLGRGTLPAAAAAAAAAAGPVGGECEGYMVEELNRLREEIRRLADPYPDRQRPHVYRVPLRGYMCYREAVIDAEDLPLVEASRWVWENRSSGSGRGHVVKLTDGRSHVPMARVIAGVALAGIDTRVGHHNGDPLDCRRSNLYVRTMQQQVFGARKMGTVNGRRYTSRFKGVYWSAQKEKWQASVQKDGVTRDLGRFRDELAAAEAYDEAARELFGEHAWLNFPDGIDAFLEAEGARAERAEAA